MLILVRHGRTHANHQGLLQGQVNHPLDDRGREQAAAVAAHLHATVEGGIDRVVASPLDRAQQTAASLGLPVDTEDRIIELNYGDWEDRPLTDVPAETWARWREDMDFRPPGGETLAELGERVRSAVAELAVEAADSNVVMVSHVSPMKASLAWALGVDDAIAWRINIAQASVCRIAVRGGRPTVLSVNERTEPLM